MRNVYIGMPRSGRSPSKVVSCTFLLHELPPLQAGINAPIASSMYNMGYTEKRIVTSKLFYSHLFSMCILIISNDEKIKKRFHEAN
jgi:hypothetical protein